jgi:hypothetical protein
MISEIITRVAYMLLNIYFLYPHQQSTKPMDMLVQNTLNALEIFLHSLRLVEESLAPPDIFNGLSPCFNKSIILLGLDASHSALQETPRYFEANYDARPVI